MWKKSLAALGFLTLLNIPVFSQNSPKTDSINQDKTELIKLARKKGVIQAKEELERLYERILPYSEARKNLENEIDNKNKSETYENLLRDYFLDKDVERSVLVGNNNLIDVTLFYSSTRVKTNVVAHKRAVDKYDTITHVHNHIEDVHLQSMWLGKYKKEFKKALRKFDEKTLENRLLTRVLSITDVDYLIFLENYALENNKKFNYKFIVTNGEKADIYEFGLTKDVGKRLRRLPKKKRVIYSDELFYKYEGLLLEYMSNHCKLWETKECKEPSNEELTDLINEQGIVFIKEVKDL